MKRLLTLTFEIVRSAVESLRANLLRSLLTSIGVMIGVAFVSLMGWALRSLDAAWESSLSVLGSDMLYVDKWDWAGRRSWREVRNRRDITIDEALEAAARLQTAQMVVLSANAWGQTVTYGDKSASGLAIEGVTAQYGMLPSTTIAEGRFFTEGEDYAAAPVAVIGDQVRRTLFPNQSPIGKTIRIRGKPFVIIGTLPKRNTLFVDFPDRMVHIPLQAFFNLYGRYSHSITLAVKAPSTAAMEELRSEVRGVMRAVRKLPPTAEDDFSINEAQIFRDQVATIRLAIWAVGLGLTALSFVVGVIGITNVMFVAVVERTKEIGIRRAVGARRGSILLQFLVEAMVLCVVGALIGVVVCSALVALIAMATRESAEFLLPVLPPEIVTVAIVISAAVGVLAGLAPAYRAARLDPVEALRYEA